METFYIPNEADIRQWISEAVVAALQHVVELTKQASDEPLLSRKEVARLFGISLVTLYSWTKNGLPVHRQGGRVFYLKTEVMNYVLNSKVTK